MGYAIRGIILPIPVPVIRAGRLCILKLIIVAISYCYSKGLGGSWK
jgi:hypothetical protein